MFSGLAFDLLFLVVVLPIRGLYFILRTLGCLILTYFMFWVYTTKILHLRMRDFRITYSIKMWGILYAVLLPVFVVLCFLVIGKSEATTLGADEITVAVIYSIIAGLKAGILEKMLFADIFLLIISGTLVGIMFSFVAYKGNSISNSSLLHFAWNFAIVTDIIHITTAQGAYGAPSPTFIKFSYIL